MAETIFEWDPAKSESNRRKHGIDFDEARETFFDPLKKLEMEGIEHGEIRWRILGEIKGAIYVVSHTVFEEGEDGEIEIIRIISARRATRRELRAYEREA